MPSESIPASSQPGGNLYEPEGHIYILKFSTGRVKVGFTTNIKTRIANHVGTARIHGVTIEQKWTSPFHKEARFNEKRLIAFCRSIEGSLSDGEHFVGVSFDHVVAFAASELTITRTTPSASQRERGKAAAVAERSRILDAWEAETQPGRDRQSAALAAAGVQLIPLATWLDDPAAVNLLRRLYKGESVSHQEIRDTLRPYTRRPSPELPLGGES